MAVITTKKVIEKLEPLSDQDLQILNEYIKEEVRSDWFGGLPKITADDLGISVKELRAK